MAYRSDLTNGRDDMDCSVSKTRRALAVVTVIAALAFVSLMSVSDPAAAGPVNLTVYGWVYDSGGQPIEGAGVVVQVQAGVFHSEFSTTDVDGFYRSSSTWPTGRSATPSGRPSPTTRSRSSRKG